MIVWVSSNATGFANEQRFEVVDCESTNLEPNIIVRSCGNGEVFTIKPRSIIGVEITDNLTIKFNSLNWSFSQYKSSDKVIREMVKLEAEKALEEIVAIKNKLTVIKEITS